MTCALRALGLSFDPPSFLADSPFRPDAVYRRGDPLSPTPDGRVASRSGFNLTVSSAGLEDLGGQIRDAIAFLDEHEDELRRLGSFEGVELVCLHFGVRWDGAAVQTETFPPELLWRAGALDIELAVSHYSEALPS